VDFNDLRGHFKPDRPAAALDCRADIDFGQFNQRLAAAADQERSVRRIAGTGAADIGIEGRQAMNQTGLLEKIKCPINRGRLRLTIGSQLFEQLVSSDRSMISPDQGEDFAAQWSEADPFLPTDLFGLPQGLAHAVIVIVAAKFFEMVARVFHRFSH